MSLNILVIKTPDSCENLLAALDQALHEVDEFDISQDFGVIDLLKYNIIIARVNIEHQQSICAFTHEIRRDLHTQHIPIIAYVPEPAFIQPDILSDSDFDDIFAPIHPDEFRLLSIRLNAVSRRFQELHSMKISAETLGIDLQEVHEKQNFIGFLLDDSVQAGLQNPVLDGLQKKYQCLYFSSLDDARETMENRHFDMFIIDSSLGRDTLKFASMLANKDTLTPVIILVNGKDETTLRQSMEIRTQGILFTDGSPAVMTLKISATLRWTSIYLASRDILDNQIILAQRDELTNLFNRRYMNRYTEKLLDQSTLEQQPFCLCIADIDHFKAVNDTYGHLIGDEVLKCISGAMQSRVRLQDVVGRWGGEEFIIIFSNLPPELGSLLADRMRLHIEQNSFPISHIEGSLRVTISIGFTSSRTGDTLDAMIKRADQALYLAKERGRNQVVSCESISEY